MTFTQNSVNNAVSFSLTTSGTGAAATLSGAVLNIPVYQSNLSMINVKDYGALGTMKSSLTAAITNGSPNVTISLPIQSFTINTPGANTYTSVPAVTLSSGTGTALAVMSNGASGGQVVAILVNAPGSYAVQPTATVAAPPSGVAPTLTVNLGPGFASADVGALIGVNLTQTNGSNATTFWSNILSVTSQFVAVCNTNAANTLSSRECQWGFDDSAAFNQAVQAATQFQNGAVVYIPAGVYLINAPIVPQSNVSFVGANREQVCLRAYRNLVTLATSIIQGGSLTKSPANPYKGCYFGNMELDYHFPGTVTGVSLKCIYMQYMSQCGFFNIYAHDAPATNIGCDFIDQTFFIGCIANGGGRAQFAALSGAIQPGCSGFGIGTNGSAQSVQMVDCYASGNYNYGVFFESQGATAALPQGVTVTGCVAETNGYGFGECGNTNPIYSACIAKGSVVRSFGLHSGAGFAINGGTLAVQPGLNALLSGCQSYGNAGDGIVVDATPAGIASAALANLSPKIVGCKVTGNTGHGLNIVASTTSGFNMTNLQASDNDFTGNTAGAYTSSGNLTGAYLINNIGYNDQQTPASITVGASPFTYTAGFTPENVYVTGGTIGSITKNGVGLSASVTGDITIPLLPNQSIIVTYTIAPTMVTDKN